MNVVSYRTAENGKLGSDQNNVLRNKVIKKRHKINTAMTKCSLPKQTQKKEKKERAVKTMYI